MRSEQNARMPPWVLPSAYSAICSLETNAISNPSSLDFAVKKPISAALDFLFEESIHTRSMVRLFPQVLFRSAEIEVIPSRTLEACIFFVSFSMFKIDSVLFFSFLYI